MNSSWLTLSKESGNGNGDLRLFFTENTDDAKRESKIKVTLTNVNTTIEQEISVEQLGTDPDNFAGLFKGSDSIFRNYSDLSGCIQCGMENRD